MIFVIATVTVQPGKRDDFISAFKELVPAVLAEDGCIEYGPTIDLETNMGAQQALRNDVVTVMEKWDDLDALEAHLIAPHMLEYRAKVKEIVASTSLQVLEPA